MGIKDFLEEAAGAVAAEQGLDALDPNANLLEKGLAAAAGFEGVNLVKEHFAGDGAQQPAAAAPADDTQSLDQTAAPTDAATDAPVDAPVDDGSQPAVDQGDNA